MSNPFVDPILNCMAPGAEWPSIAGPGGLPNVLLSTLMAQMAGINFILDFIPPDPMNLPSPPSITIFSDAFLGSMNMPGDLGEIDLGGGIVIPATGPDIRFDQTGLIKLVIILITLPFQIILGIVNSFPAIALPSPEMIADIFASLAIAAGLSGVAVAQLGLCLATGLAELLADLIPV